RCVNALCLCFFFFQAEDGIRDFHVTGVQTCALPIFCVMALLLLSLLQRQLAQKGIDISIAHLIRRLTEIEETALAYAPRPAARGKTKARSVYVLTAMDPEQRALFDALDLARYQHSASVR